MNIRKHSFSGVGLELIICCIFIVSPLTGHVPFSHTQFKLILSMFPCLPSVSPSLPVYFRHPYLHHISIQISPFLVFSVFLTISSLITQHIYGLRLLEPISGSPLFETCNVHYHAMYCLFGKSVDRFIQRDRRPSSNVTAWLQTSLELFDQLTPDLDACHNTGLAGDDDLVTYSNAR